MTEGKVSSKYQLTIPAEARAALGIKPGDMVRYEVNEGILNVSVVRPDLGEVLEQLWANHDMAPLHEETGGDAAAYVREQRGWPDINDER